MGFVGIAVTFLGVVLTRMGSSRDQQIQQTKDQFQRLLDEARYWREVVGDTRDEWESRWERQMNRCRKITDEASNTITDLMRYVPPRQQAEANTVLDHMVEHRANDHAEKPGP